MKQLATAAFAGLLMTGGAALAQTQPVIDCSLPANAALAACQGQRPSGAVVPHGSGAIGTLGPAETTGSVGIGGSGAATPPQAIQPDSGTAVLPPGGGSNAVVPHGSGAVNPLGPGESSGSAGIGGSGTSAPRQ